MGIQEICELIDTELHSNCDMKIRFLTKLRANKTSYKIRIMSRYHRADVLNNLQFRDRILNGFFFVARNLAI